MATVQEMRIELWERVLSHPNPWFKAGFVGLRIGCLGGGLMGITWYYLTKNTWIDAQINEYAWNLGQQYGMWLPLGVIPVSLALIFVLIGTLVARPFFHR